MSALILSWGHVMSFSTNLQRIRKERQLTQVALADPAELSVLQIKQYEAGNAQPTLGAIKRLALALHVSADDLIFDEEERGPDDELRMQFEALRQFTPEEKHVAKEVIESLIIKHSALRWNRTESSTTKAG